MRATRSFTVPAGLALALALFTMSARADLAFLVTPATQSGVGSNEVFFTGTLTNTSPTDELFLNNIQISFTDGATNYLEADTNAFFANVPGLLLSNETYIDIVFGVTIAPGTPPGQYYGTVTIQGGTNIFAVTSLSSQTFQVSLPTAALGITLSGGNLVLSWPSPPGGFTLLENSDLTTTNWLTVTNIPVLMNGQNQVSLFPTNASEFYLLEYP
jgi:hypothetical protein